MELLTESELLQILQVTCKSHRGVQQDLANKLGITKSYMSDIVNGRRAISDTVAEGLGFERVVSVGFKRKDT